MLCSPLALGTFIPQDHFPVAVNSQAKFCVVQRLSRLHLLSEHSAALGEIISPCFLTVFLMQNKVAVSLLRSLARLAGGNA